MTLTKTLLVGLVASAAGMGAASAADYGPIYANLLGAAPELKPVEIGTGWYLRGDASYDFREAGELRFEGTAANLGSRFDAASFEDGLALGGGIGYQFSQYLRADATVRYASPDRSGDWAGRIDCGPNSGACDVTTGAPSTRSWELMANAYVDLGTFVGFTPYVGGGVGAVNLEYEDAFATCDATFGICSASTSTNDDWRFAYALTAGVAYKLNRSLALDLGYRYLNVDGGTAYTGSIGTVDGVQSFSVSDDGYDSHSIMAGVRYSLW